MLQGKPEKQVRESSLTCGRKALDRNKHSGDALFPCSVALPSDER